MSDDHTVGARPPDALNRALAVFAQTLAAGLGDKLAPDDRLELTAYLVTWAIGDLASRRPWSDVRQRIHDTLAPAIAAGLDVGLGLSGHGCRVEVVPPYTRRPL